MKKIAIYLFTLILSLSIIISVSLTVLKFTFLDRNYVKNLLDKENYYEKLAVSTREQMKNYLIQSGFTDEVLNGIYEEEDIKNDVNIIIDQVYDNEEIYLDNTKLKDNLEKSIVKYLEDKNIKLSSQEEIDKFVNMIGDVYLEEVGIIEYLKPVQKVLNILLECCIPALFFSICLSFFLVALIFSFKGRSIFCIPLFTLSFVYLLIIAYLYNKIDINNLLILSKDISDVIKSGYLSIIRIISRISFISFILGIILSLWSVLREKNF